MKSNASQKRSILVADLPLSQAGEELKAATAQLRGWREGVIAARSRSAGRNAPGCLTDRIAKAIEVERDR